MKKLLYKLLIIIPLFLILNSALLIDNCTAQWEKMSNGIGNNPVMSLAASGNNIFAGTLYGAYISADNGENWTQTSLNTQWPYALAINGNIIFAGTAGLLGVYLSSNNGINWTQTSLNNQNVYSLVINGNNVFAGTTNNGVYLSTNNGTNWVQTSLNNRTVNALAINGSNIYAGTSPNSGLYLSTDNGTNWTQTSLVSQSIYSLVESGNNIFTGTNAGVYLSTNNGTNWSQTSLNNQNVISLAINGNNVFAGTPSNGIYVSNNNGTNWTQRNEGMGNLYVRSLCILNNYVFAGTQTAGVYRRPLGELITSIQTISIEVPQQFSLSQNYPNPFNPTTKIKFSIVSSPRALGGDLVQLIMYDVMGREVQTLVNEKLQPGTYEATFGGTNMASGIYFYRLTAGEFTDIKKLVLLK